MAKYTNGERIQLLDEVTLPMGTIGKVVSFDRDGAGKSQVVVGCHDSQGTYFRVYAHPQDLIQGRTLPVTCECANDDEHGQ